MSGTRTINTTKTITINNQKVVDAVKFAIEELQPPSDSGVYKSLF